MSGEGYPPQDDISSKKNAKKIQMKWYNTVPSGVDQIDSEITSWLQKWFQIAQTQSTGILSSPAAKSKVG